MWLIDLFQKDPISFKTFLQDFVINKVIVLLNNEALCFIQGYDTKVEQLF